MNRARRAKDIHQCLQQREFPLHTMTQEIRVYQDIVWRDESGVVLSSN